MSNSRRLVLRRVPLDVEEQLNRQAGHVCDPLRPLPGHLKRSSEVVAEVGFLPQVLLQVALQSPQNLLQGLLTLVGTTEP